MELTTEEFQTGKELRGFQVLVDLLIGGKNTEPSIRKRLAKIYSFYVIGLHCRIQIPFAK